MDLNRLTVGWQKVDVGGRTLELRLLKLREWGKLQSWLKTAVPSPVAEAARALEDLEARGEKASPSITKAVLSHAQDAARLWPPRVGTVAWIDALDRIEGGTAYFLAEAARAAGLELTDDEAAELEAAATVDEVANVFRVCLHGELPLPKSSAVPKKQGPTETPSPTTGASSSTTSTGLGSAPIPRSVSSPFPSFLASFTKASCRLHILLRLPTFPPG